jgi:sulfoxide reductase heme-binding subunit YedZ
MRRLGRRWHSLHRLVYVAALLGSLHFLWLVKADWREPALYIAAYVALMAWRWVKRPRKMPGAAAGSAPVRN